MILLESWQPGAECGCLLPIAACLSALREGDSLVLGAGDFVLTYMALTHSSLILSPTSVLVSPLSVLLLLLLCLCLQIQAQNFYFCLSSVPWSPGISFRVSALPFAFLLSKDWIGDLQRQG